MGFKEKLYEISYIASFRVFIFFVVFFIFLAFFSLYFYESSDLFISIFYGGLAISIICFIASLFSVWQKK